MKYIKDLENLNEKRVLLRLDLNVPLKNGMITDQTRIDKILPIIEFLIKKKSKVIVISHVGRPKGKTNENLSLKPICENLGKKINNGIEPTNGFIGLMLALKFFNNIKCFGFSFYDGEDPRHYYEKINCNPKNNHNFEREKIVFNLLNKNEIIKLF